MAVYKSRSGRWEADPKYKGNRAPKRTFDTKAEAEKYQQEQVNIMRGGFSPALGKVTLQQVIDEWLQERSASVSQNTLQTDKYMMRLFPQFLKRTPVRDVKPTHLSHALRELVKTGKSASTVSRARASWSALFSASVAKGIIPHSPLIGVKLPVGGTPRKQMMPWTRNELRVALLRWEKQNKQAAKIAYFLAVTGLRWGEARELRVKDVTNSSGTHMRLHVARSKSEGAAVKGTKTNQSRMVPVAAEITPWIEEQLSGKTDEDLLLPPMHATRFKKQLNWKETAEGRTIHELRHTAICLWLSAGVSIEKVMRWAGHTQISTTNMYVNYLGQDDREEIDKIRVL